MRKKNHKVCPRCGGNIKKVYGELEDKLKRVEGKFRICECGDCNVVFTNPLPSGNLSVLYPKRYLSDRKKKGGFDLEEWYREDQYAFDFGLFEKAVGKKISEFGSYLDAGCGSGERVLYVKKTGVKESWGLDKFDHLRKRIGNIYNQDIANFSPKKKFEVVSIFNVLEHLVDPRLVLKKIQEKALKKRGYLIVQVPNYASLERIVFGRRWYCFDPPRHLWHFKEKNLVDLLESTGYEVLGVYKKNAWLHPVSIAPSLVKDADMGMVWVGCGRSRYYWTFMKMVWVGLTILTIPISVFQSFFNNSSLTTVVAKKK